MSETARNSVFWGGIGLGVALCTVRIATAETFAEYLIACGLSAVEIATVFLLEQKSRGLRLNYSVWKRRKEKEALLTNELAAANREEERRSRHFAQCEKRVWEHIAYVEDRNRRARSLGEQEAAALATVDDGIGMALSQARGRVRGVRKKVRRDENA